ncbi:leucine-rich repeat domain-containing protein [Paenibacillus sp. SZ31]|uniref:leucine-rich repeat domain-containing protein n=1 Tax=Paenibacillus sp. SZ31 TaxID=2725555 RepID=UPI00146EB356|nr:leucine-rich repeat domain-containing protein [Paenibacillus sp. SZ31]NMI05532.1 leucine-rich repeat domain-containing protein [Paenibacillus sp. SZ31]
MVAVAFHTDPRGTAYELLIDELIEKTDRFMLVDRKYAEEATPEKVAKVLQRLEPYLIENSTMEEMMLKSGAMYSEGIYYIYRCTPESGQVLKEEASRFRDWLYPSMPDDLCFLKEDGSDYFYTVAHENIYGMHITQEEAIELMERITGLFFRLDRHQDIHCLLDDAIRHQTDVLNISSYYLKEIPERIRELQHLRRLTIFEQDVYTLPPALFELTTLEELEIMTADLEGIHQDIGKLKQLRELRIYCGSSYHVPTGWKPKEQSDLGLKHIPAEIGELSELVTLDIGYSGIRELPPELEQLKKLRYLSVTNGLIEETPDMVNRMTWLLDVNLNSTPLGISWEHILGEEES